MAVRKSFFAVVALLFFVLVLIATAPARLSAYILADSPLRLEGVSGTLWRGKASRASVVLTQGELSLGVLSWRLKPFSLLRLAPKVALDSTWGSQQLSGAVQVWRNGDVQLTDFSANVDARLITAFVPLAIDGVVSAQFERLRVKNAMITDAQGRLVWQNGRWLSPRGPRRLGSYAADIKALNKSEGGEGIVGTIVTLAGPVNAEGDLVLRERQYDINVSLEDERGFDPELADMLALMAQPVGAAYRINLNGAL
ncbi:MAG: general secretion pathway protein GspN [Gammaproteobacteria bacterium]|nr:MAG: general secretion pathway protein GspN [Gammaproteobacteria bacterium]